MLLVQLTLRLWQAVALWAGLILGAFLVGAAPVPLPLRSGDASDAIEPGLLPVLAQLDAPEGGFPPDPGQETGALGLLEAQVVGPPAPDSAPSAVPPAIEPIEPAEALEPVDPAPNEAATEAPAVPLPAEGGPAGDLLLPVTDLGRGPGVLEGAVFDSKSGAGLPDVSFKLLELDHFGRTDGQGAFTLRGLPVGPLTVELSKLGYDVAQVTVEVTEGGPAKLSQGLTVKPVEVDDAEYLQEDFDVVEEYVEENPFEITLGQAESPSLQGSVGQADFERAVYSDAGGAVASVSGANVVGGKFAVLRGLADRYVSTTFNGASIASAEPSRKAVQLDLFPTSSIEAINVAKTFHARLPGDFGGGAIDIVTRVFPAEQVLSFKAKQSWDPSLPDGFLVHPDRELDFFGGGVGEDLPQSILTPGQAAAALVGDNWRALHRSRSLVPDRGDPTQPLSFSLTYGDTFEWAPGYSLGVMLAGGRGQEDKYNRTRKFRNVRDGREWTQEDHTHIVDWNLYAAAGLELGEDHTINFVYFRKHAGEDTVAHGYDLRDPGELSLPFGDTDTIGGTRPYYGADAFMTGSFYNIEPLERDFEVRQILGEHSPFERGPTLRWSFTNSEASERRPDTSFHQFATLDFASPELSAFRARQEEQLARDLGPQFGLPDSASWDDVRQELINLGLGVLLPSFESNFPVIDESLGQIDTVATLNYNTTQGRGVKATRLKQVIEERGTDYGVGLAQPWYFDPDDESRGIEFQLGTNILRKERTSRGSIFELFYEARGIGGDEGLSEDDILPGPDRNGNGLANLGELIAADPSLTARLFTGGLIGAPGWVNASTGTGNNANKIFNNAEARHNIDAHYLSGRFFWDNYYLLGGLRFESEDRAAELREPKPFGAAGDDPPSISEAILLPSVTAGVTVFDGHVEVTGAWSRTVARPTFHEWMPIRSFDLSSGTFRAGNPGLGNSSITNFDLSAKLAMSDDFDVTVSGFHKRIDAPIVDVINVADPSLIQYINGKSGVLTGAEVEAELRNLGPFTLTGNVTYIDATLTYPVSNAGRDTDTVVGFPFQPEWITNLTFGYEHEDYGLSASLNYNFTGEYATTLRSLNSGSDILQNAQHAVDLVLGKTFGDSDEAGLELKLGIKNLWATDRELTYSGGKESVDGRQFETLENQRLYFLEGKYSF